ncbi:hypothetical protein [Hymenobacter sp. B81]|uniref:hypothetical protein n=1 Tax=Hymenobacter sp. B81 TaxID=3344878 RepID=UPI0037DCE805
MLTAPTPEGVVNPAELPVADAVLEAACVEVLEPEQYDKLYTVLAPRHPELKQEIHFRLRTRPFSGAACMAIAS